MYRNFIKPTFDFIASSILLITLFPLILIVVFILFFFNDGEVFFIQTRSGKGGVTFKIIKFKTMRDTLDEHGFLLPDEKRLTRLGKWLRNHSLDEILQLVNVIKGDMSLVGPRPLHVHYNSLYTPEQAKRLLVKPGITGWSQIIGRNDLSWEKKFEYDVEYVNNYSFKLDLYILLKTVFVVLKKQGISSAGHATTEEFKG